MGIKLEAMSPVLLCRASGGGRVFENLQNKQGHFSRAVLRAVRIYKQQLSPAITPSLYRSLALFLPHSLFLSLSLSPSLSLSLAPSLALSLTLFHFLCLSRLPARSHNKLSSPCLF